MKKLFILLILVATAITTKGQKGKSSLPKNPSDTTVLLADIDTSTGVAANLGCEFDGTNYWITGRDDANGHGIYQVAPDGTLLNTYQQGTTSTWGMRDMAYDAATNMLYAGDDNGFYSIDPTDGTVNTLFSGQSFGTIRALAWDGTNFWTKSFADPLYKFAPDGTLLGTYTIANSTYGMCYDPMEDCLWMHASGVTDNELVQVAIDGTLTGTVVAVNGSAAAGGVGGCFYDFGMAVPGDITIGVLIQGSPDVIWGVDMGPAADPAAPAAVSNITAIPDNTGALTVDLAWTNPALTVDSNTLTELTSIDVYSDEDGFTAPIYTNASPIIGGAETYTATVTTAGVRTFIVVGTNTAGTGIPVSVAAFVGVDVEVTSTDLPATAVLDEVITPTVTVTNNGVGEQTFDVTLTNGTYSETMSATTLAAGASTDLVFPDWTATPVGTSTFTITAADPGGDIDLTNNEITHDINIFAGCEHTLNLADSYGDGWNGNTISVSVNGTVQLDHVTVASGDAATFPFFAENGDDIEVEFFAEGGWPEECSWEVLDWRNIPILNGSGPTPQVESTTGSCPINAVDLAITNVYPSGFLNPNQIITPYVIIENLGYETVSEYEVEITIHYGTENVYQSSKVINTPLVSTGSATIAMDDDWETSMGFFVITGTVYTPEDTIVENNTISSDIDISGPCCLFGIDLNLTNNTISYFDVASGIENSIYTFPYTTPPTPVSMSNNGWDAYLLHDDGSLSQLFIDFATTPLGNIDCSMGQPSCLSSGTANEMYIAFVNEGNSQIASLNLSTLEVEAIGNTIPFTIEAMDLAEDGFIYALSTSDDKLYKIAPLDATYTEIGEIGFDAYGIQDVDWVNNGLYCFTSGEKFEYGYFDINSGRFISIAPTSNNNNISAFHIFDYHSMLYTSTFSVSNGYNGTPIANTTIHIKNVDINTDSTGICKINLFSGSHEFIVTAEGYQDYYGTIQIDHSATTKNILLFPNAIDELNKTSFTILPNPAKDYIALYLEELNSGGQIFIFNSSGNIIHKESFPSSNHFVRTSIAHLPNGIYTIQLIYGKNRVSKKLIIQK